MLSRKRSKEYFSDGIIELRLKKVERKHHLFPLSYQYNIYKYQSDELVGRCDYRCQNNRENYYAGNIGYMILPAYRGNGYALMASRLLCDLARQLKADKVYITCSPDNLASKKTIEKLDVNFIEEAAVPEDHFLFFQGEKIKDIYIVNLKKYP